MWTRMGGLGGHDLVRTACLCSAEHKAAKAQAEAASGGRTSGLDTASPAAGAAAAAAAPRPVAAAVKSVLSMTRDMARSLGVPWFRMAQVRPRSADAGQTCKATAPCIPADQVRPRRGSPHDQPRRRRGDGAAAVPAVGQQAAAKPHHGRLCRAAQPDHVPLRVARQRDDRRGVQVDAGAPRRRGDGRGAARADVERALGGHHVPDLLERRHAPCVGFARLPGEGAVAVVCGSGHGSCC